MREPANCPLLKVDPLGGDFTICCRPEHECEAVEFVARLEGSGFVPQAMTLNQSGDLLSATLAMDGTSIQVLAGFATSMTVKIELGAPSP